MQFVGPVFAVSSDSVEAYYRNYVRECLLGKSCGVSENYKNCVPELGYMLELNFISIFKGNIYVFSIYKGHCLF